MDFRRLEIFCKLMETRSFSKTGHELNLTQPTISGHIKTLEQLIGLQLFDRHRRMVRPTSAAMVLYDYAQKMLDLRQEAGFALEKFRGRIGGRLRLGGSTIPGGYLLPAIIGRFQSIYRETYLTLIQDDTSGIIDRVAEGEVELGMVGACHERANLIFEPLIEDQMVLAAPCGPPWSEFGSQIKIKELADLPFIIREEGSGTRSAMLDVLEVHGLTLKNLHVVAEMGSTEAVRQAVKTGLGVSIISLVAVEDTINSGAIKTVAVKGLDLSRRFYLVTQRERTHSPVCNAFLDFLRIENRSLSDTKDGKK